MEYGLVVLWLAMYLVVGLAALPLAAVLFPRFEDAGAAFAVPVGLAVVAVVGHLVGHLAFGWPALAAGLVVLLALSAVLGDTDTVAEREYAEASVVFAVAFCLVVAMRSFNPAVAPLPVAIGEKMLDMGLLQASLRADALPPEDMWFAGAAVQYHYGGHMLSALLALLTGTAPRFAYNLALAGFYAALVTAAYGLAGAIGSAHDVPRRAAAGLGAFFVGIAGNLATGARVVGWLLPEGVVSSIPGVPADVTGWTPTDFNYFQASRVVPVHPDDPDSFLAATEFPLFAWINADLHAHMMSQPFMLLAVALLFSYWLADTDTRRLVLFGALPPVIGLIGLFNIWSFPSVLAVTALTLFFGPGDPTDLLGASGKGVFGEDRRRAAEEAARLGTALVGTIMVLAAALVWTLPYWAGVVAGGPDQSFVYWDPWTPVGPLLLVHGAFVAVFAAFFARRVAREPFRPLAVLLAGVGVLGVMTVLGAPALGLTLPFLAAGAWLLRDRPETGFTMVLVGAGMGLVLLVELVSIEGERFNVIFKYYVHVWLFWSIAAAVLLPLLAEGRPVPNLGADVDRERLRRTGTVLAVALLALTGLYAGFAVPAQFDDGPVGSENPTLDGTAYTFALYPDEAQAIAWLNSQPGRQTIVTAAPGGYRWRPEAGKGASAPASLTGHPTVLGWFHERQYRGNGPYEQRLSDVRTIYEGTADDQRKMFDRYNVDYVYVGPPERTKYDLTVESHPDLEVAYESGDAVVYEVQT